jgi:hypothetical protein
MKSVFRWRLSAALAVLCLSGLAAFAHAGNQVPAHVRASKLPVEQTKEPGQQTGQGFVVQSLLGGQIFGYDVDRNGSEGLLSEAKVLANGFYTVATETFDQTTGRIVAIVETRIATRDDFVTLGVVGSQIGLREWEHTQGLYVVSRTYNVMNPLSINRFTGAWTPPINDMTQHFEDVEGNQGAPGVAVMASTDTCCGRFVFGSNVGANTFGPTITLTDPIMTGGVPPLLAYDSATNQAVLAQAQGAPYSTPIIDLVNLTSGMITEFTGLGDGYVNGLAVDSATGIACTATETDNAAEFYNLTTRTGIIVDLPVIGQYSGATVAVDPVHHLFLITHPVPASPGQIHVYDESGNLVESLRNFMFGPGGAYIALNPNTRTGFVQIPGPHGNFSALQSFTY